MWRDWVVEGSGEAEGGKKDGSRSESSILEKSGGVTSETNHGIAFGLGFEVSIVVPKRV